MPHLPEDAYRYFYERDFITPKEMANLICDHDPREKFLKSSHIEYKKVYQRIRDAIKRGDIECDRELTVSSKIVSKAIFEWAVKAYPDFSNKLPLNLISHSMSFSCVLPKLQGDILLISTPDTRIELEAAYHKAVKEIHELKKVVQSQAIEIDRLSVFEAKQKARVEASGRGGNKSKGVKKNYK